jgi:hypothetical protein
MAMTSKINGNGSGNLAQAVEKVGEQGVNLDKRATLV